MIDFAQSLAHSRPDFTGIAEAGMQILAHRGLWAAPEEKNTLSAIGAAFAQGHGLETDLRDQQGEIVVSHDPFSRSAPTLADLLALPASGTMALNIKADGLAPAIERAMNADHLQRSFFFDMSIPDMRAYVRLGLPVFARISDVEPVPSYYEAAAGLWLDAMECPWSYDDHQLNAWLADGKRLAIVSEELHGRPHQDQWRRLAAFPARDQLLLCTDHVAKAMRTLID